MSTFVDVSGEVNYQNVEGGLSRVTKTTQGLRDGGFGKS